MIQVRRLTQTSIFISHTRLIITMFNGLKCLQDKNKLIIVLIYAI